MSIIGGQPLTTEDIQFADLKRLKKFMKVLEGKQQDNTGVYTRELTDQEASKLWKALTHVLENLCAFTTQKTKGLQLKI